MSPIEIIAIILLAAFASWVITGRLLAILRRHTILDIPNDRSSHSTPIPRGGGIAVISIILTSWAIIWFAYDTQTTVQAFWIMIGLCLCLAFISAVDDVKNGIPAIVRLLVQSIVVTIGLFTLPQSGQTFWGYIPVELDLALTAIIWLWFLNLFNFMDGIDGLAGSQSITTGLGICAVALITPDMSVYGLYGLALAGATIGFLPWNWQPAKIFLGDVGSISIGFIIGWLLLSITSYGMWSAAILLVLYFVSDTTLTLTRRLLKGSKVWKPHREHYYQLAVRAGCNHSYVVILITILNIILCGLAFISTVSETAEWLSVSVGIILTMWIIWYFRFVRPKSVNAK